MNLSKFEDTHHNYGICPNCGDSCQPDYDVHGDFSYELVQCDTCSIAWTLHHEDKTDKFDDTEPWRTYRISDIEDN